MPNAVSFIAIDRVSLETNCWEECFGARAEGVQWAGETHNLSSVPTNIRTVRSSRMEFEGHVARVGYDRCTQNFSWECLNKRGHFRDRGMKGGNMNVNFKEVWRGFEDWIYVAVDRGQSVAFCCEHGDDLRFHKQ
jgi:hypothetical protein